MSHWNVAAHLRGAAATATHAATGQADAGAAAFALRRRLRNGAVHEHVTRQSGADGHDGVDDSLDLRGAFAATAVPVELEAQRVVHVGCAWTGEAAGPSHHCAGVSGEAVDVVHRQAGVGDGAVRRVEGEVEVGAVELAPDGGLADARDDRAVLEVRHVMASRARRGGSRCRRVARTTPVPACRSSRRRWRS